MKLLLEWDWVMPEVLPGPPDMVETQMIDARIWDFDGKPDLLWF